MPGWSWASTRRPGSAAQAAVSRFLSFSIGAILPLFPWFFVQGTAAVIASVIIGGVAALALGGAIGFMAGRSMVGTALRQLAVAAMAPPRCCLRGSCPCLVRVHRLARR